MHSTVGAGAVTGGTMDLATLLKPLLTAGDLRVIEARRRSRSSSTSRRDRALARRLQKIAIDEPSIGNGENSRRAAGPIRRTSRHPLHGCGAQAARELASRHLRDYRLPDSAIDLIDEAGSVTRIQALAANAAADMTGESSNAPMPPAALPVVDAREIEHVAARAARIPDQQATSSDRERLRTLEEALRRVVFGQDEAVHAVAQAIKRSRAGLAQPERPAGCFLFTGPTGVSRDRSSPSGSRFSSATNSSAST
jgi:ATP-dependent Clp protease ATP-binding subunit ClpA